MNKELEALERKLEIRNRELAEAHSHIAALEEKLLKLKQYRRELKSLKEERRTLAQIPRTQDRPDIARALSGFGKTCKDSLEKSFTSRSRRVGNSVAQSEYQQWFEQHRASTEELASMRHEVRGFASQPLISILTPVFDTPVPWLREAVESVLAQVYENWELLLIDDGSTATDLLGRFACLGLRVTGGFVSLGLRAIKAFRPH